MKFKIIAIILLLIAMAAVYLVTQDNSSTTPAPATQDQGIRLNQ